MEEEKFLTPVEVAQIAGMKLNTVHSWCKSKRLPAKKVDRKWRIKPADLYVFLKDKDQKKSMFNYSYAATKKTRAKKKAGKLTKITEELIEEAEQVRLRRLEIVMERFPEPQEPGVIRDWVMEHMPVGTVPKERRRLLDY